MENGQFSDTCSAFTVSAITIYAIGCARDLPAPRNRAAVDSFWTEPAEPAIGDMFEDDEECETEGNKNEQMLNAGDAERTQWQEKLFRV